MKELILLSIAAIFEGGKEIEIHREFSTHVEVDSIYEAIIDHLQEGYNITITTNSVKERIAESGINSEIEFFFEEGDKRACILIRAISGYRVNLN